MKISASLRRPITYREPEAAGLGVDVSAANRIRGSVWIGVAAFVSVSCSASSEHPDHFPADQLVFSVGSSGGGWTPLVVEAIHSPVISVYGDGRVVYTERREPRTMAPPEYLVAQADADDVARFAEELEELHLIDLGTDVGSPGVTDQATTTVTFHGRGEASELRVYAFGTRFEQDLPSTALENRDALRDVISGARDLTDGESDLYVPDTVHVHEATAGTPPDDVPSWPGPDPATFTTDDPRSPGAITGDAAALVYTAARENPGAWWRVTDDDVMRLVVDPVP